MNCSLFINRLLRRRKMKKGCLVFVDLMNEMGSCEIILDLFTKEASHASKSVIFITQNVFFKGKCGSQNVTLYRNTHILVIFRSILDKTTIANIASRLRDDPKLMKKMLSTILERYRYVVLRGDLNSDPAIRITSDYFNKNHITPHIKTFTLLPEKKQEEEDSDA